MLACTYYKCKAVGSRLSAKLCAEFKFASKRIRQKGPRQNDKDKKKKDRKIKRQKDKKTKRQKDRERYTGRSAIKERSVSDIERG